jgi:hypothetical protein
VFSLISDNVGSTDPRCIRTAGFSSGTVDKDDNLKFTDIKSTIYAVMDHSATILEIEEQKRFLA